MCGGSPAAEAVVVVVVVPKNTGEGRPSSRFDHR